MMKFSLKKKEYINIVFFLLFYKISFSLFFFEIGEIFFCKEK